jgi:hypothetical protein
VGAGAEKECKTEKENESKPKELMCTFINSMT